MTDTMPRVLIEDWLPIEAIGAESKREHSTGQHPPPNRLHVWWARRPLIVSRAAILGSVLPQWSADWPENLRQKFPTRQSYHNWFVRFLGIFGDPVAARRQIEHEKQTGIQTAANKYGYPRAFTTNPDPDDLITMGDLLEYNWGTRELSVLDPFAGGGSIPFESLRYGFTTLANDLNPVAATILKATLDYPARFGPELADDIKKWGNRWYELVKPRLEPFFASPKGEPKRTIYMWARTIACPTTGKPVPLSPNWWIRKGENPVAVKVVAEPHLAAPQFVILKGEAARKAKPDEGTVSRGVARSPWTGETISGDYIKVEAQAGRMGQILYCVEVKTPDGRDYVAPLPEDTVLAQRAEAELARKKPGWIAQDLIPTEPVPEGNKTKEPLRYGMNSWSDMFSPRQLLVLGTYVEALGELEDELRRNVEPNKVNALMTYLTIGFNKCPNYNSRMSVWHALRTLVANTFNRHDFAFAWSHAEFDGAGTLLPWAILQIVDAYKGIATLLTPTQALLAHAQSPPSDGSLSIRCGSASTLSNVADSSLVNITLDPPYYDNVQYAELADFFYVWLKRSVGHLFPEFFRDELTNKDDEAVANPARFESLGRKKKDLAEQDYERKMAAAFREMHRVLHPRGVLTVMFTHKRVEAWDTLASALIGAGFTIKASWPVHTESEHSLHQAQKNAAASTILLVCRKRIHASHESTPMEERIREDSRRFVDHPVWWDDIQGRVRRIAREKAQEYLQQGISGVDLYISVFGPTLSVISEQWPVLTSEIDPKTGEPKPLRPETALDLAREEVVRLRKEGLLAGRAIEFDPVTDWTIMAWDAFQAEEFPYDEARKLAIALGLEMDDLLGRKRLVTKKGQYVVLQQPKQRRKKGMVDPDVALFEHHIDALHTAMLIYAEDGAGACDVFLQNRGLKRDATFRAGLQALINAIPRTKVKNTFVRPEADVLDRMRLAFYADELTVPPEEEPPLPQPEQLGFGFGINDEEE